MVRRMGAQDHDARPATWDCEVPAPEHRISGRLRARQFGTKKKKKEHRGAAVTGPNPVGYGWILEEILGFIVKELISKRRRGI